MSHRSRRSDATGLVRPPRAYERPSYVTPRQMLVRSYTPYQTWFEFDVMHEPLLADLDASSKDHPATLKRHLELAACVVRVFFLGKEATLQTSPIESLTNLGH